VAQIPPESIETPARNRVDTMATHIGDELVERGPTVLRAGDSMVDVLGGAPPACGDITA
jgi:hypothetical protein